MRTEPHAWFTATVMLGLALFGPFLTAVTLPPLRGSGGPHVPGESSESSDSSERRGSRVDPEVALSIFEDAQSSWRSRLGVSYRDADLLFFTDAATTACRSGQTFTGPFYCPREERVYLDAGLHDELVRVFGAQGENAHTYAIAHAMGHHAQRALGVAVSAHERAEVELQADCFAGLWARAQGGMKPAVARSALAALSTVSENRSQRSGRAVLEGWSSASTSDRVASFTRGYDDGTLDACAIGSGADASVTPFAPDRPVTPVTQEWPQGPRGSRP